MPIVDLITAGTKLTKQKSDQINIRFCMKYLMIKNAIQIKIDPSTNFKSFKILQFENWFVILKHLDKVYQKDTIDVTL